MFDPFAYAVSKLLAPDLIKAAAVSRRMPEVVDADNAFAYFEMRDALACDVRHRLVKPTPEALFARVRACAGVDAATAGEWTERFWRDLQRGVERARR